MLSHFFALGTMKFCFPMLTIVALSTFLLCCVVLFQGTAE